MEWKPTETAERQTAERETVVERLPAPLAACLVKTMSGFCGISLPREVDMTS
jgi:hypothetical protein